MPVPMTFLSECYVINIFLLNEAWDVSESLPLLSVLCTVSRTGVSGLRI